MALPPALASGIADCARGRGARAPAGVITSALLMGFLSGCTHLPPAAQASLTEAEHAYERGRFEEAIERLDKIIRDYNQTVEISEAYYLRGLCRSRKGQARGAAADFDMAVRRSQRRDLSARAKASLAAMAYESGEWSKAARLYEEAVPDLGQEPPTDEILYSAGVALQRVGKWREARRYFGRILNRYADRPIAADARRMASWQHEFYAIQLGAFEHADRAADAVLSFRARGMSEVVQEYRFVSRDPLWVVMAGRYRTYADAVAALPRVRQLKPDAFIIPRTY